MSAPVECAAYRNPADSSEKCALPDPFGFDTALRTSEPTQPALRPNLEMSKYFNHRYLGSYICNHISHHRNIITGQTGHGLLEIRIIQNIE